MPKTLTAPCGATRSKRGKPFNYQGLTDHVVACEECLAINKAKAPDGGEGLRDTDGLVHPTLNDLDTSDLPDGAYHALNDELWG